MAYYRYRQDYITGKAVKGYLVFLAIILGLMIAFNLVSDWLL